jgi:hypothetical protein
VSSNFVFAGYGKCRSVLETLRLSNLDSDLSRRFPFCNE